MRLLFVVILALACPVDVEAAPSADGLVLGFVLEQNEVRLVSTSTSARVAPQRRATRPGWTLQASDPSGSPLWVRELPVPHLFHATPSTPIAFSLTAPRAMPGTTLELRDGRSAVRWTRMVDASWLATADAKRSTLDERLKSAPADAELAMAARADSPLARQIHATRLRLDSNPGDASGANGIWRHGAPSDEDAPSAANLQGMSSVSPTKVGEHVLSGRVLEGLEPSPAAQVRVYDAHGEFVVSARTQDDGNYAIRLPSGSYRLEAEAFRQDVYFRDEPWLFRTPATSQVDLQQHVASQNLTLPAQRREIRIDAALPCNTSTNPGSQPYRMLVNLATPDGRHVQHAVSPAASSDSGGGVCNARYVLAVSPGTYSLALTPLGWPRRNMGAVNVVESDATLSVAFPQSEQVRMWKGVLRDAGSKPVSLAYISLFDDSYRRLAQTYSEPDGSFELPWQSGWSVNINLPASADQNTLRSVFTFGDTAPPPELTLEAIEFDQIAEQGALRLMGSGDRSDRFNIVFVAEGYSNTRESFTDVNKNGLWDAVLWHDLNDDGVYDAEDFYQTYGNAEEPALGSIPDQHNEPFEDLNGDGALSLDDKVLFGENIRAYMRSLLGSDFWNDHADVFNVYAIFETSPQAGYDIVSADGQSLLERETLYGAHVELDRQLLLLDRVAVWESAAAAVPEVDLVIALVNQPVGAGRANAGDVIVYNGGAYLLSPNGAVPAHEMGHSIGWLCDEYNEFQGVNPQHGIADAGCANSSFSHRREDLPWANALSSSQATPTLDTDGSIGAFIGSSYYKDGAYRPTLNSMMRFPDASPIFNSPSRDALSKALCVFGGDSNLCQTPNTAALKTATWWNPAESGWGVFTIDQGNALAMGWFTYDDDGEPTWFLAPSTTLAPDGSRNGNLLRFKGTPFDQISGSAADAPSVMGTVSLRFLGDDVLQFSTDIAGATSHKFLDRFAFGQRDIVCRAAVEDAEAAANYSDLWWSPDSSGWGVHMSHVDDTIFATWYTYDDDRESIYMVGAATLQEDGSYSGPLSRQRNGTPHSFIDGEVASTGSDAVGTVTLRFSTDNDASFGYTAGNVTQQKTIQRLQFGAVRSQCETVDARR